MTPRLVRRYGKVYRDFRLVRSHRAAAAAVVRSFRRRPLRERNPISRRIGERQLRRQITGR